MKNFFRSGLALSVCLLVAEAQAATVTFHHNVLGAKGPSSRRPTSEAERGGGAPDGYTVGINVTTDADILSIGFVKVESSVPAYQYPGLGSDAEPPNSALIAVFPAIAVDSYITTPGATNILGAQWPGDGTSNSGWGDTSDNGPQTNFQIAQFTFPKGATWKFTGQVTVAGATGPESFQFEFTPEPTSAGLAGIGALALGALRRRRVA